MAQIDKSVDGVLGNWGQQVYTQFCANIFLAADSDFAFSASVRCGNKASNDE